MNDNEKQHARALIDRLIAEAQNDVEQKAYARALTAIRKAKVLDITNIYMLALERQVEQLKELTSSGTLTDEQRNDILESIPGIIEAAKSIQTPLATPETADAERRSTPEQLEQIRAARQWLRNQYFQRAHEYVKNHEYDRALAELRRVYVIDKQDLFAHEFEIKILQMVELQKQKPPESAGIPPASPDMQPADTERAAGGPGHQTAPSPESTAGTPGASSGTSEMSPSTSGLSSETAEKSTETSGLSSGTSEMFAETPELSSETLDLSAETPDLLSQGTDTPSGQAGEDGTSSGEVPGKNNRALLIALGIALVVVAFAFYYFWQREQPAEPILLPPSGETQEEVSDDEPMYSIPPALQIDTTKTDSTHAGTTDTALTPASAGARAGTDTPAGTHTPDTTHTNATPSP